MMIRRVWTMCEVLKPHDENRVRVLASDKANRGDHLYEASLKMVKRYIEPGKYDSNAIVLFCHALYGADEWDNWSEEDQETEIASVISGLDAFFAGMEIE